MPDCKNPTCGPVCNLARNLRGGLRLVLLLPVAPGAFAFSTLQAILLLGLAIAMPVGDDAAIYWPIGAVHAYGLGVLLLRFLALLAAVQVLVWGLMRFPGRDRRRARRDNPAGEAQVMVLAGIVWAQAGQLAVGRFAPWPDLPLYAGFAASLAFTAVWGLAAARALRMAVGVSWPLALAGGALAAIAVTGTGMIVGNAPIFSVAR